MLGSIMDSACHVWQDVCGVTGSCWIYEKTSMGVKLFVWWIIVKIVALVFYFAALHFYKPPDDDNDVDVNQDDDVTSDNPESEEAREADEKKSLTFHKEIECRESVI
jgi:hypothetical protein